MNGSTMSSPQAGDEPTAAPWTTWPVGGRVVVRRRLAEGGYADVLGDLLARDEHGVVVRTRRGDVAVPAQDIALGKPVPPPPARRARRIPPAQH